MFSFLKSDNKPVLEQDEREWMFDVYAWALAQFDADFFFKHSQLVLPSNRFFPGRASSEQGMAELIFSQVCNYAGIAHWPTRVTPNELCQLEGQNQITIHGALRSASTEVAAVDAESDRLQIPYNPAQLNNPEGLIASFAHVIAHYLAQFAKEAPPGGDEYWPHATEMIAIFLGFGLMFANSAYTFRGGCGSCYNPAANRDAYLTERQSTYALAIFAVLKGIPDKQVSAELKSHLRGFYRRAAREIRRQPGLSGLMQSAQLVAP